jgi:hypothetical protein
MSHESTPPTQLDRWISNLRNNKPIALLIILALVVIYASRLIDAGEDIWRFGMEFSEPLKVRVAPGVIVEPWFHLIVPYPPNPGQRPIPMWVTFHVTVHNRSKSNLWISQYSVSAKTENGWQVLTQPRVQLGKDTLFCLWGGLQALKPEFEFDYNVRGKPIAPDAYASGWMFSESLVTEPIILLRFDFLDRDGNVHTREVRTVTASIERPSSGLPPNVDAYMDPFGFGLESGPPLTPELEQYRQEMNMLTRSHLINTSGG